jgi:GTPase KRas protein
MSFGQTPGIEKIEDLEEESKESVYIKLAVLGKTLVGKSALTYRFISDKFPTEHDTTVEDTYKTTVTVNGTPCELEIIDTAGQDDYQTVLDTWIDFGNCFLLVYSIEEVDSFEQIKFKYERIQQLKNKEKVSIVIVGNKCDLSDEERKVQKTEAENFAKEHGLEFTEASALNRINVKEAFTIVVHDYLLKMDENNNKKGKFYCPCF